MQCTLYNQATTLCLLSARYAAALQLLEVNHFFLIKEYYFTLYNMCYRLFDVIIITLKLRPILESVWAGHLYGHDVLNNITNWIFFKANLDTDIWERKICYFYYYMFCCEELYSPRYRKLSSVLQVMLKSIQKNWKHHNQWRQTTGTWIVLHKLKLHK